MSIFRVQKDSNNAYVMINKMFLNDENISWKAKGLLAYLLSLPDDWQIYEAELVNHAADGKDSLKSAIKELENAGYIERTRKRDEKGMLKEYEYCVYEIPISSSIQNGKSYVGKTYVGKSYVGLSNVGKSATTNNNNTNNNNTNNNNTNNNSNKAIMSQNNISWKAILEKWNSVDHIQTIRDITENRKKKIKTRMKNANINQEQLITMIDTINQSPCLQGFNSRNWKITLDWLIKNDENFIKVLEGKYVDNNNKQNNNNDNFIDEWCKADIERQQRELEQGIDNEIIWEEGEEPV